MGLGPFSGRSIARFPRRLGGLRAALAQVRPLRGGGSGVARLEALRAEELGVGGRFLAGRSFGAGGRCFGTGVGLQGQGFRGGEGTRGKTDHFDPS